MITLAGFYGFVLSKGDEGYEYGDCLQCPLAQYLKSLGYKWSNVGTDFFYVAKSIEEESVQYKFDDVFNGNGEIVNEALRAHPRRFDALADRLERIM